MKKFIKNLAFAIGWCLLLFIACTKDTLDEIPTEEIAAPEVEKVLETENTVQDINKRVFNYLIKMGYTQEQIVEEDNVYVVDGDILYRKDMILPKGKKGSLTDHLYTGNLVTDPTDIKVYADDSMDPQTNEVNTAIALWNDVNSLVKFRRVYTDSENHDILITNVNISPTTCGDAFAPSGGNPGNRVRINIALVTTAGHNFDQRMINIAHELGHTIGFQHTTGTNNGPAIPVPGFPGQDLQSIMRGQRCGMLNTVLSPNDRGALRSLYPLPAPLALNPSNINLTSSSIQAVNITGTGPVTVRLSGDPGLILFHGSSSGTSLNLTAPNTFEVYKQWGSGYSRVMLDSGGINKDIAYVIF